jgi:hypothetical protein
MKKLIVIAVAGLLACPGLSLAGGDQPTTTSPNLNSSKSNVYRQQNPPTDPAINATSVKSSKSNSSDRTSGQSGQAGIAVGDPGVSNDKPVKTK